MPMRAFQQVDVFTQTPYRGNGLAVVLDGAGLTDGQMQAFAAWTQLSEAAFLLPATTPQADYRVRIFTTERELPFAGHPTLGSCHAWLQAGGRPKADEVVQECGVGLVRIRRDGARLAFAAPPLRRQGPLAGEDVQAIVRALRIAPEDVVAHAWCDNGPRWRGILLRSAAQVLALQPDMAGLAGLEVGVVGPHAAGQPCAFEVRAFFPGHAGTVEDPVTGSLNAALGQWLIGDGHAPASYVAAQGTMVGRAGRVHVERDAEGTVWVGGASVTCVRGEVLL